MAKSGFHFAKFDKFVRLLKQGPQAPPPYGSVFKQWGARYLTWTKELFVRNSMGGGDWPDLKARSYKRVTGQSLRFTRGGKKRTTKAKAALRQKRLMGRIAILRDTGTLFKALTIGNPGNLFRYLKDGVRVGFGGSARHPGGKYKIKDIATAHDQGKGDLPKRQILHPPDAKFTRFMLKSLSKAVESAGRAL